MHAATPFQLGKPVAVITERLFFYLTRVEQETLAGNIHALLALRGGLWISPDVTTKQPVKLFSEKYDTMRQWIQHLTGATGRDIEGDAFEDENDVRQFFTAAGFAIEEFSHSNVLEDLSSVKLAKLSREEIVEILRTIKTLILTILQG